MAALSQGLAQMMPPVTSVKDPRFIASIVALLLSLVAWPVLLYFLTRLGLRRIPKSDDGEPRCGGCGYLVRGLSILQCPECGGDLRVVGITRASPAGFWWVVISWTVLISAGGMVAIGIIFASFALMTHEPLSPENAWLPTIVSIGYVATWAFGLLLITRTHRRPTRMPASLTETKSDDEPTSRVLTIMFIDVEDFTGLAAASSRTSLLDVIRQARELVKPALSRRGGRIVKTMGDGFLATFESPTEAVLAGCDVQAASRAQPATTTPPIRFRIGVATGEVAIEEGDVFGEPVNLAARVQQVAPPGDVFFSSATYHAMSRSEVAHEEAGVFDLKGIAPQAMLYRAKCQN